MSALVDTATQTRSLRDAVVVVTGGSAYRWPGSPIPARVT
jgi:hypothetical protein